MVVRVTFWRSFGSTRCELRGRNNEYDFSLVSWHKNVKWHSTDACQLPHYLCEDLWTPVVWETRLVILLAIPFFFWHLQTSEHELIKSFGFHYHRCLLIYASHPQAGQGLRGSMGRLT